MLCPTNLIYSCFISFLSIFSFLFCFYNNTFSNLNVKVTYFQALKLLNYQFDKNFKKNYFSLNFSYKNNINAIGIIQPATDKNTESANFRNAITATIPIAITRHLINISKLLFGVTSFIFLPSFFDLEHLNQVINKTIFIIPKF